MNAARVRSEEYIQFLIASPRVYSCMEAARVQPEAGVKRAHDAYTRLLQRLEPDATELWAESEGYVNKASGILILDDSTLDKPYAKAMELVGYHWSGKHHRTVKGINLLTLLWSEGESHIPCDYRLYDRADGKSKNDHFQAMLTVAHERGFAPEMVLFDSWYSSLANLKHIHAFGWHWLTQFKHNRLVNPQGTGLVAISTLTIPETGVSVHLKGFGMIQLFKLVATNGDIEYWATNCLDLHPLARLRYSENAWAIEAYHRGIKQFCGIQNASVRSARAQRNHIGFALRAFLRLEVHSLRSGCSWFHLKLDIIRSAVRSYLLHPKFLLSTA